MDPPKWGERWVAFMRSVGTRALKAPLLGIVAVLAIVFGGLSLIVVTEEWRSQLRYDEYFLNASVRTDGEVVRMVAMDPREGVPLAVEVRYTYAGRSIREDVSVRHAGNGEDIRVGSVLRLVVSTIDPRYARIVEEAEGADARELRGYVVGSAVLFGFGGVLALFASKTGSRRRSRSSSGAV